MFLVTRTHIGKKLLILTIMTSIHLIQNRNVTVVTLTEVLNRVIGIPSLIIKKNDQIQIDKKIIWSGLKMYKVKQISKLIII